MYRPQRTTNAFTLIELLVVIAIIAILAAILFPVFAQAREQARTSVCISNTRQIGLAVRMYVTDYDELSPIFYAYNTLAPDGVTPAAAGYPAHKGVEVLVLPYTRNKNIFQCPDDLGGPSLAYPISEDGCPGLTSYWACYGSSYRFDHGSYSTVAGESSQNNVLYTTTTIVTDASFALPAETRIMRDEMMPWFGPTVDPTGSRYGYEPSYYQQWHPRGGGFVFADGHSKFVVGDGSFDQEVVCPSGNRGADIDPNAATDGNPGTTYYWLCD